MGPKDPKPSNSYEPTLLDMKDELAELLAQRKRLDNRIGLVRDGITVMTRLVQDTDSSSRPRKKGLTGLVRQVMKGSDWLSAGQIRDALKKEGLDIAAYKNIFAEINMILKRLGKSGEIEVDDTKSLRPVYRGKPQ